MIFFVLFIVLFITPPVPKHPCKSKKHAHGIVAWTMYNAYVGLCIMHTILKY